MFKKIYIDGKETRYSVSDDGRIRNDESGKELKGTKGEEYHRVILFIDNKPKTCLVHKLVALAFLPNPDNLPIVHHIDENKFNNCVSNLQWVTNSENVLASNHKPNKPAKQPATYTYVDKKDPNWRDIPNFEGYKASKDGRIYNGKTSRILNGSNRNGYIRVNIHGKSYSAHVLIYTAFYGEIPVGMVIDHINGKKDDNRIENLRCITQSENMNNAHRLGHKGQVKIGQYDLDGNFIKEYSSYSAAAREFNVTYSAISSAAKRGGTSCGYIWKIL